MVSAVEDRHVLDRKFFGRMAIAIAVVVFIGFAPSFYLRGLIPFPRPNPTMTPLVWAHGLVFTGWVALFYAQARLVAANRRDLHMKLGIGGFALAIVMLALIVVTAIAQVPRATQPPYIDPVSWTAVPFSTIPPFALFLWLGWVNRRRDSQAHKRAMLILGLLMLEPAIGRMIFFPPSYAGQYASSVVAWATIIPLLLHDRKVLGHLHWVSLLGAFVTAAVLVLRFTIWTSQGWHRFVEGALL